MSIKPIKTIFIGTPDFAVSSLKALIKDNNYDILAVVTQPDKKIGRKHVLTYSPVKKQAQQHNIPILQPSNISEIKQRLKEYQPDVIIVVAYAQKIPQDILNIPRYGIFNVHSSLLPKYRGAACIQKPLLNGDKKTGVTIMKMDNGLDTGNILTQKEIPLTKQDTASSILDKLAEIGARTLPLAIKDYIQGKLELTPQDDSLAIYVTTLKKEDGKIDWEKSAEKIERMVRALNPWPGAYSYIKYPRDKKTIIKILETNSKALNINQYQAGTLFTNDQNILGIQCGSNALEIKKIQPEAKLPMSGQEFLQGYIQLIGKLLE